MRLEESTVVKSSGLPGVAGIILAGLFATAATAAPADSDAARVAWNDVPRVIAFADVHGAYGDLVPLLRKAGVIDAADHWAAGSTHVVSLGDLLDRGPDSRKVMDLLMRLQHEASAAGGQLHVVLGNHEAMNLLGDLRYVAPPDYAAYTADEPAQLRDREKQQWTANGGAPADFDKRFPPGYFGHRALLAPRGTYGAWLLTLPVAIAINDTLFMHGGTSSALNGLTLQDLNLRYRTALVEHLNASAPLRDAGLIRAGDAFDDWARLAAERLPAKQSSDPANSQALAAAVARFATADRNPLLESDGPNWYRGTSLCHEVTERDVLEPVLDGLKLRRLVVGHTIGHDGRVASRFEGTVYKLDAGMNREAYHGHPAVLLLAGNDAPTVLYSDADAAAAAVPAEPVYLSSQDIGEPDIARLLASGTVTAGATRPDGAVEVKVAQDGRSVAGVFVAGSKSDIAHELAAWSLDQALGLGIVPATVEREVEGKRGYLQARPAKSMTQTEVQTKGTRGGGYCAFEPQFQLMYTFDALIGNEGRTPDRMAYDTSQWTVFVTNHDRAFGTGDAFPAYLKATPPRPGAELRSRLQTRLDAEKVAAAVGQWLSAREQKAILARRDALLALPAAAAR
jgi:hypothetical protein